MGASMTGAENGLNALAAMVPENSVTANNIDAAGHSQTRDPSPAETATRVTEATA